MSSKKEVKPLAEYRQTLVQKAPEESVQLFDRHCKEGKKIAAIQLLKKYGIVKI